jgi:dipeptidyl aminopeptidase/acylaminoacyl peptidase
MELFLLKDGNPEAVEPAHGTYLVFESHGSRLFGRLLLPDFFDRESRCPVVVMLHGHPGGDKNLDIGEALRANGFAVAVFSYRGVWGSHGDYLLSHNIEDVISAVDFLRQNAATYRLDSDKVYLFGHSMGGFSALNAMARGLQVSGAVLMAPCDTGYRHLYAPQGVKGLMDSKEKGYFHLASENAMEEDIEANAEEWYFPNLVAKLDKSIPYCFIGGSNDTTTPPEHHIVPMLTVMQEQGFDVCYHLLEDGHMFPLHRATIARIALEHFSGK